MKKKILYYDDDDSYVENLKKAHGNSFEIIHKRNLLELRDDLEKRSGTDDWPDILLLDLYWPKDKTEGYDADG